MSQAREQVGRHLAVQLHGLREEDRRWLLSQIDGEPKAELDAMLCELASLGFRAIDRVATSHRNEATAHGGSGWLDLLAAVDRADPACVLTVVRAEPGVVTACLDSVHHWRWRGSVARDDPGRWPAERRAASRSTSRVERSLVAALSERLEIMGTSRTAATDGKSDRLSALLAGARTRWVNLSARAPWRR